LICVHPRPFLPRVFPQFVPENIPRFRLAKNALFLGFNRNSDQIAAKKSGYSVFVLMKDLR